MEEGGVVAAVGVDEHQSALGKAAFVRLLEKALARPVSMAQAGLGL